MLYFFNVGYILHLNKDFEFLSHNIYSLNWHISARFTKSLLIFALISTGREILISLSFLDLDHYWIWLIKAL